MREILLHIAEDKLPEDVRGMSTTDGKKAFVLVNSEMSEDERTAAFLHEMLHIWHGDHEGADADVEAERHAELKRIMQLLSEQ